jgi:hypothetical protein
MFASIIEKWKEFVDSMNAKGIPMPMIRDPKQGASVSLTLVFISFNIWVVSIVGKWSGQLGGIDPSQTLNMFMVCAGLYFGRKMQKNKDGSVVVEEKQEPKKEE